MLRTSLKRTTLRFVKARFTSFRERELRAARFVWDCEFSMRMINEHGAKRSSNLWSEAKFAFAKRSEAGIYEVRSTKYAFAKRSEAGIYEVRSTKYAFAKRSEAGIYEVRSTKYAFAKRSEAPRSGPQLFHYLCTNFQNSE